MRLAQLIGLTAFLARKDKCGDISNKRISQNPDLLYIEYEDIL